ncbi:hypothetical protein SDC9_119898 [bioreactor metagenome]|uniref:Uncharacterized protein n=1 Tax=bioreactor metagenome TaxID=1076179 RepID=A0A645C5K2_9ZZZZ
MMIRYFSGQFAQNPVDFGLFLQHEFLDFIIQIDQAHWFDIEGLTRSALVMNQSGHAALMFGFDRNDVPVTPYGKECFLQVL